MGCRTEGGKERKEIGSHARSKHDIWSSQVTHFGACLPVCYLLSPYWLCWHISHRAKTRRAARQVIALEFQPRQQQSVNSSVFPSLFTQTAPPPTLLVNIYPESIYIYTHISLIRCYTGSPRSPLNRVFLLDCVPEWIPHFFQQSNLIFKRSKLDF